GRNDRSETRGWIERALVTAAGDAKLRARAHAECAADALARAQLGDAERHALAAREHALEAGEEKLLSGVVRVLCLAALERADFAAAVRFAEESHALSLRSGDRQSILLAQIYLGYAKRGFGAFAEAAKHFRDAADGFAALGDALSRAHALHGVADSLLEQGRVADAKQLYHDVLRTCVALVERDLIAHCVAGLAAVAVEERELADAARLWGAVHGAERRAQTRLMAFERALYEPRIDRARRALGEETFAAAYAEGVALSERAHDSAAIAAG
ncbi:MAG TPA: hypothetical protein VFT98_16360, partial [Myxococcota bacterium]|nr:hypothetical protein [Myxococcota bacterium]